MWGDLIMPTRSLRLLEAPESTIARTEKEEIARQASIDYRAQVLAGTLPVEVRAILNRDPNVGILLKMWDDEKVFIETSLVNQAVRLKKIRQGIWSFLKGSADKKTSCKDCYKIRPKQEKAFKKLKKRFLKTGGGLVAWQKLVDDVCTQHGLPQMYFVQ